MENKKYILGVLIVLLLCFGAFRACNKTKKMIAENKRLREIAQRNALDSSYYHYINYKIQVNKKIDSLQKVAIKSLQTIEIEKAKAKGIKIRYIQITKNPIKDTCYSIVTTCDSLLLTYELVINEQANVIEAKTAENLIISNEKDKCDTILSKTFERLKSKENEVDSLTTQLSKRKSYWKGLKHGFLGGVVVGSIGFSILK